MSRQIKVLLAVFLVLLIAIVANLTWIQIFGSERIYDEPTNTRRKTDEYSIDRGQIATTDGVVLARSKDTGAGSTYRYLREYGDPATAGNPLAVMFANLLGYDSPEMGRTGIEEAYNRELLGGSDEQSFKTFANKLLRSTNKGNSIELTVDSRLQATAYDALEGRKGAVVAINPKTGAVLAMVSSPSFDPNIAVPMGTEGERKRRSDNWKQVSADKDANRAFDRARLGLYPPGSAFKPITASAALQYGFVKDPLNDKLDPLCTGTLVVNGNRITDFNKSGHGKRLTLTEALAVSCNVTFAQLGLNVGPVNFLRTAEAYGFNRVIPFVLLIAKSHVRDLAGLSGKENAQNLAWSAVGQDQDLATPFEMAMVASGIANGGVMMKPYMVSQVKDYNGKIVAQSEPEAWRRAVDARVAEQVAAMMVEVVDHGTGQAARIKGLEVAGKTGTAEVGNGQPPHGWFICFAPAGDAEIAVAVVVENAGQGAEAAAPVARAVLERWQEIELSGD